MSATLSDSRGISRTETCSLRISGRTSWKSSASSLGGPTWDGTSWEGSFRFISRSEVSLANRRGDSTITYPVAEYGQLDPLLQSSSAASGVHVYRAAAIPQLADLVLFGDLPSGEILSISADGLHSGGQDVIRRVLLNDEGEAKTLLQIIRATNAEQGRAPATRVDLRMGSGPEGQVLLLNKQDGIVRMLVPDTDM